MELTRTQKFPAVCLDVRGHPSPSYWSWRAEALSWKHINRIRYMRLVNPQPSWYKNEQQGWVTWDTVTLNTCSSVPEFKLNDSKGTWVHFAPLCSYRSSNKSTRGYTQIWEVAPHGRIQGAVDQSKQETNIHQANIKYIPVLMVSCASVLYSSGSN